ncbi:MAG TPA: NAD(P)/FAD-dependent oxidoreductase [Trueperaceae bacterium]|nr:NAD(P)/FAD-dependent oxidoreductase [Trueperaceae bacterium]
MTYDVAIVGGGVAGATLARSLALAGARVVVVEAETEFRDRVRGDMMYPWGAAELERLGLFAPARASVAIEIPTWVSTIAPMPASERHFPSTTPSGLPALGFFHPELQEFLLDAAESAGAEVRRGARVVGVTPAGDGDRGGSRGPGGGRASVAVAGRAGGPAGVEARLVVGADGRGSRVRGWAGFTTQRDPGRLVLAGALCMGVSAPRNSVHVFITPTAGTVSIVIPMGAGRHRVYGGYELRGGRKHLSGAAAFGGFLDLVVASGAPAEWFTGAELAGPLAAFDGADTWVESPYRAGVALVGDAAAASDPSFGCGMSLACRDARVLADALLARDDWNAAAGSYADEHAGYYGALHRRMDWLTQVLRETGPDADSLRRQALPFFVTDPTRVPDVVGQGPDGPSDDLARRRFLGQA